MLEQQLDAVALTLLRGLRHALDQPPPRLDVRRLERIVVALDPWPDDQVRAERAGELRRLAGDPARLGAQVGIGVDEAAVGEPRVEVQAARDAIDVVAVERRLDILQVFVRKLVGVVELVPVHQVPQALDRAVDLLGHRLGHVIVAGLVAAGHEPGDHRPERPNTKAGLQHGGRLALTSLASEGAWIGPSGEEWRMDEDRGR